MFFAKFLGILRKNIKQTKPHKIGILHWFLLVDIGEIPTNSGLLKDHIVTYLGFFCHANSHLFGGYPKYGMKYPPGKQERYGKIGDMLVKLLFYKSEVPEIQPFKSG